METAQDVRAPTELGDDAQSWRQSGPCALGRPTFCSCKRTLPDLPVPAGGVHSNTSRMLRVLSMQCARLGCSNVNTSWGRDPQGLARLALSQIKPSCSL